MIERVDDLQCKGYKIIQNPEKFCFGMDAVLLSDFVRIKRNERALDLCTGFGIVPILLCAKTVCTDISAIELQQDCVDMAERSVKLNGLEDRIQIIQGDIRNAEQYYPRGRFHVVTANPPYMNMGGGQINRIDAMAIAKHEIYCTLEDVISAASILMKTNGRFYMVHRPHRLNDIISTMRTYKIEPKIIRFVHSYLNKKPILILVEGVRNGLPMVEVMPPLLLYNENGEMTDEVKKIYGA